MNLIFGRFEIWNIHIWNEYSNGPCLHSRASNFKYLHLFILNSELFWLYFFKIDSQGCYLFAFQQFKYLFVFPYLNIAILFIFFVCYSYPFSIVRLIVIQNVRSKCYFIVHCHLFANTGVLSKFLNDFFYVLWFPVTKRTPPLDATTNYKQTAV